MSPKEGNDESQAISYPSPSGDGIDTGPFYHAEPPEDATQGIQTEDPSHLEPERDRELEPKPEPKVEPEPSREHGYTHEQREQNGTHDSHVEHSAAMAAHEPPESPQVSRPPNFEELQLAAQLGHGLSATAIMHPTDPNMSVEDSNLRAILPHPEPNHHHQDPSPYMHEAEVSAPMQQHHPMPAPPPPPPMPQQYTMNDHIPPRKRSKVSRACDECRRKKIKCDAQSDNGDAPCFNCSRSSIRCLFSRIPQKRGPSKGYIKELADRIHSIENKLESEGGLSHDDMERLFMPDHRRSGTGDEINRKRPYSSISGGEFATPSPAGQSPWAAEPRPLQAATPYNESSLDPEPSAIPQDPIPAKDDTAPESQMNGVEEHPEFDEGSLLSFQAIVQPVFPILPNTTDRMLSLLEQCPPTIKSAFMYAILAVSFSPSGNAKLASSLLNDFETGDNAAPSSSVPRVTRIVQLQALLLLAIDADSRNLPSLPFLLSRAIALANLMRLWRYTPVDSVLELDSDEQLCVRMYWSLVLMDRWHAVGAGKAAQIPDTSAVPPPRLASILGETCFQLVRLSRLLKQLTAIMPYLQMDANAAMPPVAGLLNDVVQDFRDDLSSHIDPVGFPMVHLAYWHCRTLVYLVSPSSLPTQIQWSTKELVSLLAINAELRAPLTNHFAALAALALSRLARLEAKNSDIAEEAVGLVKSITDRPGTVWDGVRGRLTQLTRPKTAVEAAATQGLEHLATTTGSAEESDSLAGGYMNA
jgi:hypothetical protein